MSEKLQHSYTISWSSLPSLTSHCATVISPLFPPSALFFFSMYISSIQTPTLETASIIELLPSALLCNCHPASALTFGGLVSKGGTGGIRTCEHIQWSDISLAQALKFSSWGIKDRHKMPGLMQDGNFLLRTNLAMCLPLCNFLTTGVILLKIYISKFNLCSSHDILPIGHGVVVHMQCCEIAIGPFILLFIHKCFKSSILIPNKDKQRTHLPHVSIHFQAAYSF